MTPEELAERIDYSLLKPDDTVKEVERICREAKGHGIGGVCLHSTHVALAKKLLRRTGVRIVAVAGYPHGAVPAVAKAAEAEYAMKNGADEVDMVMAIDAFKSKKYGEVEGDVKSVAKKVHSLGGKLKVIVETGYLTRKEIATASKLVARAGTDFVKTGTGYGPRGATVEDVRIIRRAVGPRVGIKAAGGIRTARQAIELIRAGADRIGTSAGPAIVRELKKSG